MSSYCALHVMSQKSLLDKLRKLFDSRQFSGNANGLQIMYDVDATYFRNGEFSIFDLPPSMGTPNIDSVKQFVMFGHDCRNAVGEAFTIEDVEHTVVDEARDVYLVVSPQPALQALGALGKRSDELFEDGQMKCRRQQFAVHQPLVARACNQAIAQEVVEKLVEKRLLSVLLRAEYELKVLGLEHHEEREDCEPESDDWTVHFVAFRDSVGEDCWRRKGHKSCRLQ